MTPCSCCGSDWRVEILLRYLDQEMLDRQKNIKHCIYPVHIAEFCDMGYEGLEDLDEMLLTRKSERERAVDDGSSK